MAKTKEKPSVEKGWEIKDRTYFVTGRYKPLTLRIPSKHSTKVPMLWYDEETNTQRELRYATNMDSPFRDEQEGEDSATELKQQKRKQVRSHSTGAP